MIKPLKIGNLVFPNNLIQGPLAGVSCAPFRLLTTRYGQPAFTCTEMMSSKTLLYQTNAVINRYVTKDKAEGPVSFQLSGTDKTEIAEAAKCVTDYGADLIDLNCGCPVLKIRRRGAGSSLLMNADMLYNLISGLKQSTHLPITIKIRVEGKHPEKFHATIATVIEEAGADALIVHGRHWRDSYDVPCHYDDIHYFVNRLKIPVIGNGDISDVNSLNKMFATGCAGFMISRAGVGQPWLFEKLKAQIDGVEFQVPRVEQIGLLLLDHVRGLSTLLNNEKKAIFEARSFAKYYARTLPMRNEFCIALNKCITLGDLENITRKYFNA